MSDLKEKELEKINGGKWDKEDPFVLGKKLQQYDLVPYIGQEVAVVDKVRSQYAVYGTLMRTYEDSWGCGTRTAVDIKVHEGCEHNQYLTCEGYAICYVDSNSIYLIEKYK